MDEEQLTAEPNDPTPIGVLENFLEYISTEEVEALSAVVICAETINSAGRPELSWWADDLTPAWKADGMLKYVRKALERNFHEEFSTVSAIGDWDDEEEED